MTESVAFNKTESVASNKKSEELVVEIVNGRLVKQSRNAEGEIIDSNVNLLNLNSTTGEENLKSKLTATQTQPEQNKAHKPEQLNDVNHSR
jgi:hypothetical protein